MVSEIEIDPPGAGTAQLIVADTLVNRHVAGEGSKVLTITNTNDFKAYGLHATAARGYSFDRFEVTYLVWEKGDYPNSPSSSYERFEQKTETVGLGGTGNVAGKIVILYEDAPWDEPGWDMPVEGVHTRTSVYPNHPGGDHTIYRGPRIIRIVARFKRLAKLRAELDFYVRQQDTGTVTVTPETVLSNEYWYPGDTLSRLTFDLSNVSVVPARGYEFKKWTVYQKNLKIGSIILEPSENSSTLASAVASVSDPSFTSDAYYFNPPQAGVIYPEVVERTPTKLILTGGNDSTGTGILSCAYGILRDE